MANKRGGLGRGLSALLGERSSELSRRTGDVVEEIPLAEVQANRYQPRQEFESEALNDLAESIKTYGVLQPIIVRRISTDSYEIIAGERRVRASRLAGLEKIPAIIREYTDAQTSEIAIIENVQRENLNPIEEAKAYVRLIKEFGYTQDELATKIGRSRSYISSALRILKLHPQVQDWLKAGELTFGQARPLLTVEDQRLQVQIAEMIKNAGASVRSVELFIKDVKANGTLNLENFEGKEPFVNQTETTTPPSPQEKISPTPTPPPTNIPAPKISVAPASPPPTNIPAPKISVAPAPMISQPGNVQRISPAPAPTPAPVPVANSSPNDDGVLSLFKNRLTELLGTNVEIVSNRSKRQIQINFSNNEQLLQILRQIDRTTLKRNAITPDNLPTTNEGKAALLTQYSTTGRLD